ncbi:hypothetical protein [Arhodomonas aquaeolei]|uniref:hypothetical protein n=1 Tax=Arhodomonas aquaeolei TaxID=2369 RepID=UPI002167DED6|nr:hypothetical protein [Arhodomonas aquaeolei]
MSSDVATPAGLSPPLWGLTQFFQSGDIHGRSIADVAGAMYREGYDFGHFVGSGIPVLLVEAVVRTGWVLRRLNDGAKFQESLPTASEPRLRTMLLLAHGVASGVNAGKITVTRNPLALNYPQWLACIRYLLPHLTWMTSGKHRARGAFIQGKLDERWSEINGGFETVWRERFPDSPIVVL